MARTANTDRSVIRALIDPWVDGSVGGGSEKLEEFFNFALDRFSDMNALTVGETKNSETPPEE